MSDRPIMRGATVPYAVFNLVGDTAAARAAWKARFENRKPPTEPRAAKKIEVKAAAVADTTDIMLYDEIGPWGISAKDFNIALAGITTSNICVRINSPGGDVFDGMAIYNALKTSSKNISCVIDGLAASAASFIAMAGSTVSIHESAMVMIHRAWGFAIGNAGDMAEMVTVLNKIDGEIAAIYSKQSGKTPAEMLQLMIGESDGTWFTSTEAAAAGLVDEVIAPEADEDDDDDPAVDPDPNPDPDDPDSGDPDMKARVAATAKARRRLALAEVE